MSGTYKFKGRAKHSAPVIGDSLYLWGGDQPDLPLVHDSPEKEKVTSTVETFSFSSARWSSHLTRGTPPLGVVGYSCATFRSNIYYYSGSFGSAVFCNSLNVLNTLTMRWTQLHPNDESRMKKGYGGMLSLEFDGTDYLFMVGGMGSTLPAVKHPQFKYEQTKNGFVVTNEQLLYNLSNEQFTVPSVSGQCCPPTSNFTINKINGNKGIMFGGIDGSLIATNNVYIFNVTHNTIHWESIEKGLIPGEGLWPMEKSHHASAIINGDSTSPALVVIGGTNKKRQPANECLLFNNIKASTGQFSCKKIPLPESVTRRYAHSLTAVTMSPHCVWLVIVGGLEGGFIGMLQHAHTPITDYKRLIMIIELVYIEAGEWIVQSLLDGNDLASKKYQEKYSSYIKTRTWWMDQLTEYPTEKEMKLRRYIQSLHQELQVAHQNKVSLQEALTEANKQGSKVDGSQLVIMNEKLDEVLQEKQVITEDIEKLRATVAYNEVYITEIEEEKKQVQEEKRKVEDENKQAKKEKEQAEEDKRQLEEQYLIDKQITKELKAKVAVNDVYITELEKENEKVEKQYCKEKQITKELKSQVTELEEEKEQVKKHYLMEKQMSEELKSKVADIEKYTAKLKKSQVKETNSKEVQFDYMIPSMDNLECLSDVQVAEKKLFLIQGDKPQLMNWEKYGLRIGVQEGSLLSSETVEAAVVALVGGQFEFPPNTVLVSAVYAVSLSKPLLKRLKLEIQHCIDLTGRPDLAQYLKFAIAPVSTPSLPYLFKFVEGGEFSSNGGYGFIERKDFCLVCILGLLFVAIASILGGGVNLEEHSEQSHGRHPAEKDHWEEDKKKIKGEKKKKVEEHIDENNLLVSTSPDVAFDEVQPTGVKEAIKYAGLVYYEEKGLEDLVTFTAAKNLEALIRYIERKHSQAEIGPDVSFCFQFPCDHIKLNFTAPQKKPFTGWTLTPQTDPCRLYQEAIDKFGDKEQCYPSRCLISVYGSPDAVPFLNYFIPLEGVACPVSLNIHRARRNLTVPVPPSKNPSTSSSTGGASVSATVDVNKVKKVINDVLVSHYADLTSLPMEAVPDLANQLFSLHLVNNAVRGNPSIDKCIDEFKASLNFKKELPQVEEHCQKFLSSFIAVRGSYADAAIALGEDWIEAVRNKLGFDFNVNLDA